MAVLSEDGVVVLEIKSVGRQMYILDHIRTSVCKTRVYVLAHPIRDTRQTPSICLHVLASNIL